MIRSGELDQRVTLQSLDNNVPARDAYGAPSQSWPATYSADDAVRIRFVAGYGGTGSDVPAAIRAWMQVRVASLYAQREAVIAGVSIAEIPGRFLDGLLDPYRIPRAG